MTKNCDFLSFTYMRFVWETNPARRNQRLTRYLHSTTLLLLMIILLQPCCCILTRILAFLHVDQSGPAAGWTRI